MKAAVPKKLKREGMELADENFIRGQRTELGALHRLVCGLALGGEDTTIEQQSSDGSPLHLFDLFGQQTITRETVNGATVVRRWCGSGGFVIHDKCARGEAMALQTKFWDRLRASVEKLADLFTKKHGLQAAMAALPDADRVRVAAAAGCCYQTDNAAPATAGAREYAALVREDVRQQHGAEAFDALAAAEQEKLTKVFLHTCMRHLCNTFLDGGCAHEKAWLEPLLAASIEASPAVLRLSADVNKLFHALAKGLGEGIDLYGHGEGVHFRAWLEKNFPLILYLSLLRFDKGARMDGQTEAAMVLYFNRPVIMKYLGTVLYSKSNLLRDNLFCTLASLEIVATLRGRAAFHDKARRREAGEGGGGGGGGSMAIRSHFGAAADHSRRERAPSATKRRRSPPDFVSSRRRRSSESGAL